MFTGYGYDEEADNQGQDYSGDQYNLKHICLHCRFFGFYKGIGYFFSGILRIATAKKA